MASRESNMITREYYGGCRFIIDLEDSEASAVFTLDSGRVVATISKTEIPILIKHFMENND